ncbi:hypothetical protein PLICRDRAFT_47919 [Plicaturopsis crispa FD-325 SS-3]|nr:hypothetical protein PLICRDRAFT_47919 [Plicaturopsis crispa FD-325 SS-3]
MINILQVSVAILLFAVHETSAAKVFGLQTGSYPDVADHHCIAWACDGVRYAETDPNPRGFHRATSLNFVRNRRHAIGCDGVTQCGSGRQCDEIPYASTFDGGLGCYASEWTNSGRPLSDLYNFGTHRCVSSHDNGAHGSAVSTFYSQQNVGNFGLFFIAWITNNNGCTSAPYCNRFLNAFKTGQPYAPICAAARADGRQYAKVTSSAYTRAPRCPSRNYRRDTGEFEDDLEDEVVPSDPPTLDANATLSPRVGLLDNGMKVMETWGQLSIGDEVWIHDETLLNGTFSKIVNFTTPAEAFGHLEGRQQC